MKFTPELRVRARTNLAGFERRAHPSGGRRPAAVALVLLPDDEGRACFVLTRRADRLRAHARSSRWRPMLTLCSANTQASTVGVALLPRCYRKRHEGNDDDGKGLIPHWMVPSDT